MDPNWTPGGDDDGAADGANVDASGPGGGHDDGNGSPDNVAACQQWIDDYDCGGSDFSQFLNCDLYAMTTCDIADYFDCLTDNTSCNGGVADVSGWMNCLDLAQCG